MPVHVDVLRVFVADDTTLGNELGVIESSTATRGREQRIAHDLGFSETVFIDLIDGDSAVVRIFTPTTQFGFAGHPTVGVAWHLIEHGHAITRLIVPAGSVAVSREGEHVFVRARPEWSPTLAYHERGTPDDVDALDADTVPGGFDLYWSWRDEAAGAVRARMFGRDVGIREDQATGSAAIVLTSMLQRDLDISQGLGSHLMTRWNDPFVELGGRTVWDRAIVLEWPLSS